MASPHALSVLIEAAFLALLAGCAQSVDPWVASQRDGEMSQVPKPSEADDGFQTGRQVVDQLSSALKNFEGNFPDAHRGTVLVRLEKVFAIQRKNGAADGPPGPVSYESGYAESIVLMEWLCSWEGAYLRAHERNDEVGTARAAANLATLHDLEYAKRTLEDPERVWDTEVLNPALRGDTRAMAEEYETCAVDP